MKKEYKIGTLAKKPKPIDPALYTIGALYNAALGNPFDTIKGKDK